MAALQISFWFRETKAKSSETVGTLSAGSRPCTESASMWNRARNYTLKLTYNGAIRL